MAFNLKQGPYERLRRIYSEGTRDVAFWTGAGISRPAGFPSWEGLRAKLVVEAQEKISTMATADAEDLENKLERINADRSLWESFETLREILGEPQYIGAIRSEFERHERAEPPQVYRELWKLRGVSSLITLNLDGLARRSHRLIRTDDAIEFTGKTAHRYLHRVANGNPFIASLHGIHEDSDSWVFTKSELEQLLRHEGYRRFIEFLFSGKTIVFLGISANDVAVGGFLEKLTRDGVHLGQHFWITDRNDGATHRWANAAQLQVITYQPSKFSNDEEDHSSPIIEILSDLNSFISKDVAAPPVVTTGVAASTILEPNDLIRSASSDELRVKLASHSKWILDQNNGDVTCKRYSDFLNLYSRAIHLAWHVTAMPPENRFFGYKVEKRISSNPFSAVWQVADSDGSAYALKIMKFENLENGPQIDSFRRGVQSLRYLTAAEVPGTAPLKEAAEIPTCIVMKFIDGQNLADIAASGRFDFWGEGLKILENVAIHLENSHALPEGVLHRDIRPSNIMVPRFHWDERSCDDTGENSRFGVVLLNYDMSWHASAKGESITGSTADLAFYAPEQVDGEDTSATRSALVDSYGLGMTIYYCATGKAPPFGIGSADEWMSLIDRGVALRPTIQWRSAANRVRWLIKKSTEPLQKNRLPVRKIRAVLSQLNKAIAGDLDLLSTEFRVEELIARAFGTGYQISDDGTTFDRSARIGRNLRLRTNQKDNTAHLTFHNSQIPGTKWSNVKSWYDKLKQARDELNEKGWEIQEGTKYAAGTIYLEASINSDTLRKNFNEVVAGFRSSIDAVTLD